MCTTPRPRMEGSSTQVSFSPQLKPRAFITLLFLFVDLVWWQDMEDLEKKFKGQVPQQGQVGGRGRSTQ